MGAPTSASWVSPTPRTELGCLERALVLAWHSPSPARTHPSGGISDPPPSPGACFYITPEGAHMGNTDPEGKWTHRPKFFPTGQWWMENFFPQGRFFSRGKKNKHKQDGQVGQVFQIRWMAYGQILPTSQILNSTAQIVPIRPFIKAFRPSDHQKEKGAGSLIQINVCMTDGRFPPKA